jgi:hypothetical protein
VIFGPEGVVLLFIIGFWVWALLDVIATDASDCRNLPKGVWLILVLLLGDIGALAWILFGRPPRRAWLPKATDYSTARPPIAVEDQPDYVATAEISDRRSEELDRRLDEWEAQQRGPKPEND